MTESRKPLDDGAPSTGGTPPASVGHVHAREEAIARLGAELSAATIETIRRMHVSGEPGVDGWIGIAKQVEAIAREPSRDGLRSLRETVKEGK